MARLAGQAQVTIAPPPGRIEERDPTRSAASALVSRAALTAVLIAASVAAALDYHRFLLNPRQLWRGLGHDRNGHYEFALKLALSMRQANLIRLFADLEKAKVWPPLHGLLAALILAIAGPDYRRAVLPSLIGWWMTAVFGFMLARRLTPRGANAAGIIAASMILASPGYRAYATDIMLDSLGAGLSMLALYAYVLAKLEPTPKAWRRLAIALTLLFCEKYNYWMLVAIALGAAEILSAPADYWREARDLARSVDWRIWTRRQLSKPLNFLMIVLALISLGVWMLAPNPIQFGSHTVSLYPPRNILTAAYWALALRVLIGWRRSRGSLQALQPGRRELVLWHALPICISFLLPGRLATFLWYLGPSDCCAAEVRSFSGALAFYAGIAATQYHANHLSALASVIALLAALISFRRWKAGGGAVLLLLIFSTVLVAAHPNQQDRFVHSWLAVGWVAGAVGIMAVIYSPWPVSAGRLRHVLAAGATMAAIAVNVPVMARPADWHAAGLSREAPSLLDLSDTYLEQLAGLHRVAFFSTFPDRPFIDWTYLERYRRREGVEWALDGERLSAEQVRAAFAKWAATTKADAALFIDVPPGSADYSGYWNYDAYAQIGELMRSRPEFQLHQRWYVARHGCWITMWLRQRISDTHP